MNLNGLKNKVLQLAIQGKLVEQNDKDKPASVLLEEIRNKKEELIKEKKIKKEKPFLEITDKEKLFELPDGWKWVRLGEVTSLISGRDLSGSICNSDKLGIPYIMGASNMTEQGLVIERWVEKPTVIGLKDDIMISVKGTVGKVEIITLEKVHLSRQVMSIRCLNNLINNKYLLIYLKSYMEKIKEKSSGVIPGISREDILQTPFAIPPIEEQQRIVTKIEELFLIIDELNENKEAIIKNISDLRDKTLQLAIQGKLVEQNPEDTPAEIILDRIVVEKERLVKEKKIKKEKPLPNITDEEKLFDIPNEWQWCRLGEIAKIISKGTTPKGGKNTYLDKGINFLRVENITNKYDINLNDIKYIDETTHEVELKRSIGEENDLLISIAGTLGRVSVLRKQYLPCNMNQAISFVRIFNTHLDVDFFKYVIASPTIKKSMIDKTKTTAQPNLTLEIISNLVVPIPPLEEQQRIVSKIDEIIRYLDDLEDVILK